MLTDTRLTARSCCLPIVNRLAALDFPQYCCHSFLHMGFPLGPTCCGLGGAARGKGHHRGVTAGTLGEGLQHETTNFWVSNLKTIEVLSVERTCLYKELFYTDYDFHLNLGFKFSTQTMPFTFNLDSIKDSLPRQCF